MKRLFILVAIIFMVSIWTPDSIQKVWNADKLESINIEKWTGSVKGWFAEQDISGLIEDSAAHLEEQLTQLFQSSEPASSLEGTDPSESGTDPSEFEKEVVKLVNDERTQRGLEPLEMHNRLSDLARKKSRDMKDNNYFSHTSPTYGSPFDMMNQFDFNYRLAGENIAAGQRSPEQVVEGWMSSEGHRENILKEGFTHIGVGYVEGNGFKYGTYWTQLFMTPR
ncbi:CAP domain-containing protein [Lentibacillus amyloliquefaciens]|uniref:SCP domain-containing protein n=1 Tax=Lentibacillus amyloliquefaciens TaxID=1472767 RepID=A0A0U4FHN1_9BACI|nr:CAP domain-containing protein [Lentibacillus amyloliquefaciens]ALX50013.1 hypothetical protein AOX59_16360 [Lentibacillus amyloliquefaciens]